MKCLDCHCDVRREDLKNHPPHMHLVVNGFYGKEQGTLTVRNQRTGTVHVGEEHSLVIGNYVIRCKGFGDDWSYYEPTDEAVTCKRCLRRKAKR